MKVGAVIVEENDVDTSNQQTLWTRENDVAKQKWQHKVGHDLPAQLKPDTDRLCNCIQQSHPLDDNTTSTRQEFPRQYGI